MHAKMGHVRIQLDDKRQSHDDQGQEQEKLDGSTDATWAPIEAHHHGAGGDGRQDADASHREKTTQRRAPCECRAQGQGTGGDGGGAGDPFDPDGDERHNRSTESKTTGDGGDDEKKAHPVVVHEGPSTSVVLGRTGSPTSSSPVDRDVCS